MDAEHEKVRGPSLNEIADENGRIKSEKTKSKKVNEEGVNSCFGN
jgi:hypothetical protein